MNKRVRSGRLRRNNDGAVDRSREALPQATAETGFHYECMDGKLLKFDSGIIEFIL